MDEPDFISKGNQGTFCDTALKMKEQEYGCDLNKGFLTLALSYEQMRDLRNWLDEKIKVNEMKIKSKKAIRNER